MSDQPTFETNSQTIELDEKLLIGKGARRFCYEFPGRADYCIKIPQAKKNGYLQQRREVRYYQKLTKRGVPTERITRYHGIVETSLGTGYVYDAIRDSSGEVSKQMITYLEQSPQYADEYLRQLKVLEDYLFDHAVIFYGLSPWNILCKEVGPGKFEPYIIDGIGDVVAIPVLNLSRTLVLQKIRRRWMRMIRAMSKRFDWMSDYRLTH